MRSYRLGFSWVANAIFIWEASVSQDSGPAKVDSAGEAPADTWSGRFHGLDALRGFALVLGVFLHATLSFIPEFRYTGWPIIDTSSSTSLGLVFFVIHLFRMPVFFLLAGFFGRMQFGRLESKRFIKDRTKRILLPLLFGTFVIAPINVVLIAVVVMPSLKEPIVNLLPNRDIVSVPLAHLWFLWILYWFYLLFLAGRAVYNAMLRDKASSVSDAVERVVSWICARKLEAVVLSFPVALALVTFDQWHLWEGVPSPNTDLVPQLPSAVSYSVAFAFGWFLQKNTSVMFVWRKWWGGYLVAAVLVTAAIAVLGDVVPSDSVVMVNGAPEFTALTGTTKLLCALGYGLASWLWIIGLVGLALRFWSGYSAWRRYLADSSYWLYIIHLPLVMALQEVVADWPMHWSLKYVLILAVTLPLLLLSYRYLVRPTWVGAMLNGKRQPRSLPPVRAGN
jgi:peptidoglycan/LPS O-acetylase OafA/YrhL